MPRQPRIEFPGAVYHILARGDRREDIFVDDHDRDRFLETLSEACGMTGWRIYAWVLMSNHYHVVLKTPDANLVAGMKWLQNTYTRRFNSRHKLWGHVFGGRYKSILVDEGDYTKQLIDYVHLNPVRAKLVRKGKPEDLLIYPWSSLSRDYMAPPEKRPKWMEVSPRLESNAGNDKWRDRKKYLEFLHGVALSEGRNAGLVTPEGQSLQSTLVRGWYWGSKDFSEQMLKLAGPGRHKNVNDRSSPVRADQRKVDSEKIIGEGLKKAGLTEKELISVKGSHRGKVVIALALKAKTVVGNQWIADRLKMKTAGNVSQLCGRYRKGDFKLPKELELWLKTVKNA